MKMDHVKWRNQCFQDLVNLSLSVFIVQSKILYIIAPASPRYFYASQSSIPKEVLSVKKAKPSIPQDTFGRQAG